MGSFLTVVGPMFAFMLIPVWIPLIAVSVGALLDLVRPRTQVVVRRSAAREPVAA